MFYFNKGKIYNYVITILYRVDNGIKVHRCHSGLGETCISSTNLASENWPTEDVAVSK